MKNEKILWAILLSGAALTLILEPGLHRHSHFSEHGIDGMFGFFAGLSVLTAIGTVLISKIFKIFRVKEEYYDNELN